MSHVILHLGGNWRRVEQTAIEAVRNPDALIVVSSEGGKPQLLDYLRGKGIEARRVIFDDLAYDTVGNICDTFPLLRRLGATRVSLVTNDWHMPRAMAIANVAYAFTGITPVACPWREGRGGVDRGNVWWDVSRTIQWRITGQPTSRGYRTHQG